MRKKMMNDSTVFASSHREPSQRIHLACQLNVLSYLKETKSSLIVCLSPAARLTLFVSLQTP